MPWAITFGAFGAGKGKSLWMSCPQGDALGYHIRRLWRGQRKKFVDVLSSAIPAGLEARVWPAREHNNVSVISFNEVQPMRHGRFENIGKHHHDQTHNRRQRDAVP